MVVAGACVGTIGLGMIGHGIRSTPAVTSFLLEHAAAESLDQFVEVPPRSLSREAVVMWQYCMVEASIAGMQAEDLPDIFRQQGFRARHPWGARLQYASLETPLARVLWASMHLTLIGVLIGLVFTRANSDDIAAAAAFLAFAALSVASFAWYLMRRSVTSYGRLVHAVLDQMDRAPQDRRRAMRDLAIREIDSGRVQYSSRGWPVF